MPVSLKNTPYIFTIKTFYYAGRRMTRLVQIAGRVGELGRRADPTDPGNCGVAAANLAFRCTGHVIAPSR